ncbi:MAG: hypothetical protein ACYTF7_03735 [Planctomycetota bacterium]|jgi:predicted negative regulator of RcsB-dependent stress response
MSIIQNAKGQSGPVKLAKVAVAAVILGAGAYGGWYWYSSSQEPDASQPEQTLSQNDAPVQAPEEVAN